MNPLIVGLALALALSMGGTAAIGWAWLGTRDELATATVERDNARGLASACNDATEALREQADQRAAAAKPRQAAARATAATHGNRALEILTTPAAVPGDDYASARRRVDGWLQRRRTP